MIFLIFSNFFCLWELFLLVPVVFGLKRSTFRPPTYQWRNRLGSFDFRFDSHPLRSFVWLNVKSLVLTATVYEKFRPHFSPDVYPLLNFHINFMSFWDLRERVRYVGTLVQRKGVGTVYYCSYKEVPPIFFLPKIVPFCGMCRLYHTSHHETHTKW